jgi:hypothetical protein
LGKIVKMKIILIQLFACLSLTVNAQTYPPGPTPTLPVMTRMHLPVQAWPEGQVVRQATPPPDPATVGTNKGSFVWLKTGTDSVFVFVSGLWRPIKGSGGSVTVVQQGPGILVTSVTAGSTTTYTVSSGEASQTLYNQSGTSVVFTGVPQNTLKKIYRSGLLLALNGDYTLAWSAAAGGTLTVSLVRAADSETIQAIY